MMPSTIAEYVVKRLRQNRVDTLFGVPAVYCAELFERAASLGMATVVNTSDVEAGYAADGYARRKGLGAVSVAYGVGTLSLANAIAGAYAERSPVIVVNGGPNQTSIDDLTNYGILYSHSIGKPHTDIDVFRNITAAAVRVTSAAQAPSIIDSALTVAITRKRPVYVEVPLGLWTSQCADPTTPLNLASAASGEETAIAADILARIKTAKSPIILLGVEIQRYGLAATAAQLVTTLTSKYPAKLKWVSTLLAKSVIAETVCQQQFAGVFADRVKPTLAALIAGSDLIVALGCVFGSGHKALIKPAFDRDAVVHALDGKIRVPGTAAPQDADIVTFVTALKDMALVATHDPATTDDEAIDESNAERTVVPAAMPVDPGLTYSDLFDGISKGGFLDGTWLVITDTFLGEYPAARLELRGQDTFMTSAVWASIGHSIGAAVGAAFGTTLRPIVICGDGGFQIIASALSTMVKYKQKTVVVVVDNGLYGIEQFLRDPSFYSHPKQDPLPYMILNRWDYAKFAVSLGFSYTATADTRIALNAALAAAKMVDDGPTLIRAVVQSHSLPPGL